MTGRWPVRLIRLSRALTVGLAYYSVMGIPDLPSSFVAISVTLLMFDLMISLEQTRGGWDAWKEAVRIVIPSVAGTALTLAYGLIIGGVFAVLVHLGLPVFLGAILTVGLSYSLTESIPGRTSRSVGIVGGLAVFHRTYKLAASAEFFPEVGPVIVSTIYGTLAALVMGWAIGIVLGGLTRLLLPRGYRSVKSSAYELPLELRPVQDVLHLDEDYVVATMHVSQDAPVAGYSLDALDLRQRYEAMVLRIDREGTKISLPTGEEELRGGDGLLVCLPELRRAEIEALFAAAPLAMVHPFPVQEQGIEQEGLE
ncbi:MAG: hypothetical protein GX977_03375 [Firmicutes bacterium]|nr:hypothetical protein [Bacillota bacterium]